MAAVRVALVWLCLCLVATGKDLYVSPTGNDSTGDGTQTKPYKTLTVAYSKAANQDRILLLPGTYQAAGNVGVSVSLATLTIAGSDPANPPEFDLSGNAAGTSLVKNDGSDVSVTLSDFKVKNNPTGIIFNFVSSQKITFDNVDFNDNNWKAGEEDECACIFLRNVSFADVKNSDFEHNYSPSSSAAVHVSSSNGTFSQCQFLKNEIASSAQNGFGAAVYVDSTTSADAPTFSDCTFESNVAAWGAALYGYTSHVGATLILNNCVFSLNSASEKGGAIWTNLELQATGSIFNNNTAKDMGGAFGVEASPSSSRSVQITDCSFTFNSAANGSAGYISSGVNFQNQVNNVYIRNSHFDKNGLEDVELTYGGALYVGGGEVNVIATAFSGNFAFYGGAIWADPATPLSLAVLAQSGFVGNSATVNGGAIGVAGPLRFLEVADATFSSNNASGVGGAIFLQGNGVITSSSFTGNIASQGGALVVNDAGLFLVSRSAFNYNVATIGGGAVDLAGETGGFFYKSTFNGNTATGGSGGAVWVYDTALPIEFDGCDFRDNSGANHYGLDLYATGLSGTQLQRLNFVECTFEGKEDTTYSVYARNYTVVFEESCAIHGVRLSHNSTASFCSCPSGTTVKHMEMGDGNCTVFSDFSARFDKVWWTEGGFYYATTEECLKGNPKHVHTDPNFVSPYNLISTGGFTAKDDYPFATHITRGLNWVNEGKATINQACDVQLHSDFVNNGQLTLETESSLESLAGTPFTLINSGTVKLKDNAHVDGSFQQHGTGLLDLEYTDVKNPARLGTASLSGKVKLVPGVVLAQKQSLEILLWGGYSGKFQSANLTTGAKNTSGVPKYEANGLWMDVGKPQSSGMGGGAVVGILFGVLIGLAIIGAVGYMLHSKMGNQRSTYDTA